MNFFVSLPSWVRNTPEPDYMEVERARQLRDELHTLAHNAMRLKNGEVCGFTLEELNQQLHNLEDAVHDLMDAPVCSMLETHL